MRRKRAPIYEVLWPLGRKVQRGHRAAARIPDLSGKTIGELWDAKFHGETIYPILREHLGKRYPGVKFVEYTEFGNFYSTKETEILNGLAVKLKERGCDAVITGIGA